MQPIFSVFAQFVITFFVYFRYGRDHKIPVTIVNYDNPQLMKEIMAEVVVLKKTELDLSYEREISRTQSQKDEENTSSTSKPPAKRRKTGSGKDSEIQGALALMELARN